MIIEYCIRATEAQTGESADFLRDIWRASGAALFKFALFLPLALHRKAAPATLYHVAQLVAVRHEDCGPCLQTIVGYAKKAGIDPAIIRACIAGQPDRLPDDAALAYHFAEAVVSQDAAAADLSAAVARRHGEATRVDLALTIAATRMFPTIKRALGHAQSCSTMVFDV